MFAYCENNPIKYTDPTGTFADTYHQEVTYKKAKGRLFDTWAKALANACKNTDTVFSPINIYIPYCQSFHFNINLGKANSRDSRDIRYDEMWEKAKINLAKAEEMMIICQKYHSTNSIFYGEAKDDLDKYLHAAFRCFGYAIHTQQDKIIHGGRDGNLRFPIGGWYHKKEDQDGVKFDTPSRKWYLDTRLKCSDVAELFTGLEVQLILHDLDDYTGLYLYCTKNIINHYS